MSRYRIQEEMVSHVGCVFVIQVKVFWMWWTMKGKYLHLEDAMSAYDKLEQS